MEGSCQMVSSRVTRGLIEGARALGVRTDDLELDADAHNEARVPQRTLLSIWELVSTRSRDPFFGLHFAERIADARADDAVRSASRPPRTVGDALASLLRMTRAEGEVSDTSLAVVGDVVVLTESPRGFAWQWPRHFAEAAIATYVLACRRWSGLALRPRLVAFQHAAPADSSEHRRIFGCEVRFGAPRNRIELDRGILPLGLRELVIEAPIHHAPSLTLVSRVPRQDEAASDAIRRILREKLHDGAPTLPDMARALSTSARTLQRRLSREGVEYRRLVEDVRREAAMSALHGKHITVEAAAEIAGYADARAFRRAVVRWTGRSPKALRSAGLVPELAR